jgi:hypothetical protein
MYVQASSGMITTLKEKSLLWHVRKQIKSKNVMQNPIILTLSESSKCKHLNLRCKMIEHIRNMK